MSGAILLFPHYASMAWCSVKAKGQLYLLLYKRYKPSVMQTERENERQKINKAKRKERKLGQHFVTPAMTLRGFSIKLYNNFYNTMYRHCIKSWASSIQSMYKNNFLKTNCVSVSVLKGTVFKTSSKFSMPFFLPLCELQIEPIIRNQIADIGEWL